jgi:hypothetical protein
MTSLQLRITTEQERERREGKRETNSLFGREISKREIGTIYGEVCHFCRLVSRMMEGDIEIFVALTL